MGFRTPTQPRVNLKEYEDEIVALRAISWQRDVNVTLPPDPENGTPGGPAKRDALLANLAVMTPDGPQHVGETLVFYQVIAETVDRAKPDWTLGILHRKDGEEFTYFILEDLDEDDFEKMAQRFDAAGIGA